MNKSDQFEGQKEMIPLCDQTYLLLFTWQDILNYADNIQCLNKKKRALTLFSLCFAESSPYLPAGLLNLGPKLNNKSRKVPSAKGTISQKLRAFVPPRGSAKL